MTVCVSTAATPNRNNWVLVRTHYYSFYTYKTYEYTNIYSIVRFRTVCINTETGAYVRTVFHRNL